VCFGFKLDLFRHFKVYGEAKIGIKYQNLILGKYMLRGEWVGMRVKGFKLPLIQSNLSPLLLIKEFTYYIFSFLGLSSIPLRKIKQINSFGPSLNWAEF